MSFSREAWYDEKIAPELARLAEACAERGMSFLSVVEYEPDNFARTQLLENPGRSMAMMAMLATAVPNVDRFLIDFMRYCKERNIDYSNSLFLSRYAKQDSAKEDKRPA